jgi:hypothetical protein
MSQLKDALKLAKKGFYVFPVHGNGKLPRFKGWQEQATTDPKEILKLWKKLHRNIGIFTSKYKENEALVVVDVDVKKGKEGDKTLKRMQKEGLSFPKTLTQKTPTGGLHLIYKANEPVPQGSENALGKGLDIRSKGGLIIGAGSKIKNKKYEIVLDVPVAKCPQWIIDRMNEKKRDSRKSKSDLKVSQKSAVERARRYLLDQAPTAIEGQNGDNTTFTVASRMKDFGVAQDIALLLMLENWNESCEPPWEEKDLAEKIANAYKFNQNEAGCDAPENDFEPIKEEKKLSPIDQMNEKYGFAVLGGKSTIIEKYGSTDLKFMSPSAFHDLLNSKIIRTGDGKIKKLSKMWFESPERATYNAIDLLPEKETPKGVFNLWRGFSCTPLAKNEKPTKEMLRGVALFKEHCLKNVCQDDKKLYRWLIGYFAHMIQKPWQKPLTALVFKGKKGVGKNAFIERVGNILGEHFLSAANKRYLVSNFNSHLAKLIFFVLDEAAASKDKHAEGVLKDLVTGSKHIIEQKGRDPFTCRNLVRPCVLSNENWVVPASEDERRFAIFNIGTGRQGDRKFFEEMRILIDEKGGNRLLLTALKNYDLSQIDLNDAPKTEGLLDQKVQSFDPLVMWFFESIKEEAFLNLEFKDDWPNRISQRELRLAYIEYVRERNLRDSITSPTLFTQHLREFCPKLKVVSEGGKKSYAVPKLSTCKRDFDKFIGQRVDWASQN